MIDVNQLLPQLAPNAEPLYRSKMFEMRGKAELIVARDSVRKRVDGKGTVVAMTTMLFCSTLTNNFALIEDVVTDAAYRRRGINEHLNRLAIDNGRILSLSYLELHSRSSRAPAHALYKKLGYVRVAEGKERIYYRYYFK